jgi:mannose-6-phosphate isomerase
VLRLRNPIKPYAWGSHTGIAGLLGEPVPTPEPQAELWMGAHPTSPSAVRAADDWTPLDRWIASDPGTTLGARVQRAYGAQLPFLLKVLACEMPLSLQAHPDAARAKVGFAREERAGLPLGAPERHYKDDSHKPELICALSRFDAFCGFRPRAETLRLFGVLGVPELEPILAPLRHDAGPTALKQVLSALLDAPSAQRHELAERTTRACDGLRNPAGDFAAEFDWARRLAALYPGDIGIVCALFLNLVCLSPGQALYLPPGSLHAYLHGTGVEIMASSDNVLRGGLTPKFVDTHELLQVVDFHDGPVSPSALVARDDGRQTYLTEAKEFELSVLAPAEGTIRVRDRPGPEIVLAVAGHLELRSRQGELLLAQGESAFVPAADGDFEVKGTGRGFSAAVRAV